MKSRVLVICALALALIAAESECEAARPSPTQTPRPTAAASPAETKAKLQAAYEESLQSVPTSTPRPQPTPTPQPSPAAASPADTKAKLQAAYEESLQSVPTSTPRPQPSPAQTAELPPTLGDAQRVGDLGVRPIAAGRYPATDHNQFNTATYRVRLQIANVFGSGNDAASLQWWDMQLWGTNAHVYAAAMVCVGCPEPIGDFALLPGGAAIGSAYFEVPEGVEIAALVIAQPLSLTGPVEDAIWILP